jgi:hypothetical protein
MPDHEVVEERRWELRPVSRWPARVGAALLAGVWLPVEAGLLWFTGFLAGGVPYDAAPGDQDAALRWLGIPFGTAAGVYAALWTAFGWLLLDRLVRGGRSVVVVVDGRGVRTERATRGGRRVGLDLAWGDVRAAGWRPGDDAVELHGTHGTTLLRPAGDADQHLRILRHIDERLAELPERPPVVPGHNASVDDHGATLIESRRTRLRNACWTGGLAVVCGVNGAALALVAEAPGAGFARWLGAGAGAVGLWLAAVTAASVRRTPRWIARPGAVVLERRPGGGLAFEARSLELVRHEGEGRVVHRLLAVADADGGERSRRKTILVGGDRDEGAFRDAGAWLARHAEIPLRHVGATSDVP